MNSSKLLSLITFLFMIYTADAQDAPHIKIYEGKVFNAVESPLKEEIVDGRVYHVIEPEFIAYFPEKQDSLHTSVIIFPGGGYARLAMGHEGLELGKAFNKLGITVFVLKYRLPNDSSMVNKSFVPLADAQQAIHFVRKNAQKWNLNPTKIGVMGFSAGGHLAASLSTLYNYDNHHYNDSISLRPDFCVLGYPVISFRDSVAHSGSKARLVGKKATEEMVKLFSCDEQVNANTPPTLILVAADDKTVPAINSKLYYEALLKNKVPAEIHIFQNGGHGFGLNLPGGFTWVDIFKRWIVNNKF